MSAGHLANTAEIARRCGDHPGGSLHQRLDDHGGQAVVGEEYTRQSRRRQRDQPMSQLDRRHVADAEKGRMRDTVELLPNGVIELRHTMTVDVAPERRDAVDVTIAVKVEKEAALGTV